MIGLSLSLCVKDLAECQNDPKHRVSVLTGFKDGDPIYALRNLSLSDVDKVICGTKMASAGDYEKVCDRYMRTYWKNNKLDSIMIFKLLTKMNLLEQPRVYSNQYPLLGFGRWVTHENLIVFGKERKRGTLSTPTLPEEMLDNFIQHIHP